MRRKRGVSVAIAGVDGVGKSTLVGSVAAACDLPIRVAKTRIHSGSKRSPRPWFWMMRTLRSTRQYVEARLAVRRGEIVLWDRHPMEHKMMSEFGRDMLGRGRGWLARVAPRPDMLVVLDAPIEMLLERRPDESATTMIAMREGYLRLSESVPSLVIDAMQPAAVVRDELIATLVELGRASSR